MPAVSVLIPCYNVERYLRQCLDSVVNQTLRDIEIICINDGSTDGTPAILGEYSARDSRILVIDKPNSGYGDSMNQALDAAAGEYIGIVESDDWADADMFETLYDAAKKYDVDMVKSNFYDYRGGESTINEIVPKDADGKVLRLRDNLELMTQIAFIWTGLYRREWLNHEHIRFLPTPGASYQDNSFGFKALACAERAFFTCHAFLHYRRDNETSSIHDKKKVFCICDEFKEIEAFSAAHPSWGRHFQCFVRFLKYNGYLWNFRRLDYPLNKTFACRVSADFREDFEAGLMERSYFKPKHYRRLCLWAFHPTLFFWKETLLSKNGRRKLLSYVGGAHHA